MTAPRAVMQPTDQSTGTDTPDTVNNLIVDILGSQHITVTETTLWSGTLAHCPSCDGNNWFPDTPEYHCVFWNRAVALGVIS
jgi:hypothetical protein